MTDHESETAPVPATGTAGSSLPATRPEDSALVPLPPTPRSLSMTDPEGKIRTGQFRTEHRLARHSSFRPYEKG